MTPLSRETATSPRRPTAMGTFETPPVSTAPSSMAFCQAAGTAVSHEGRMIGCGAAAVVAVVEPMGSESGALVQADAATVRTAAATTPTPTRTPTSTTCGH